MRWIEDQYNDFLRRRDAGNKNSAAGSATNLEQGACDASVGKEETPRPDGPVDITVISHLSRERDPDGTCFKYCLDAIVDAGILSGDTSKEIKGIRHQQTKAAKGEEKTVIVLSAGGKNEEV